MNIKKRINQLEKNISKTYVDPVLEVELIAWLKKHPNYHIFAQTENNNGVDMPEYLSNIFMQILNRTFEENNLQPSGYNLLKILNSPYSIFKSV